MKRVIEVIAGDEYKEKVETTFKKDSLFAPVYRQAYKIVEQILLNAEKYENDGINYSGNNIILFSADRGQGKTSAMLSFGKILQDPAIAKDIIGEGVKAHFEVMRPIDPSSLDETENIIRVLISRLFYLTGELINNKKCDNRTGDKYVERKDVDKILASFKLCYQSIDSLRKGRDKSDIDDIEELSRLGNSSVLKQQLYDLVKEYLLFAGKQDNKKSYLVIRLDDADLFTKNIFEICEDIHDFLSIPNVIILMAVNYKQLCYNVYQRYLVQYKDLQPAESGIPIYRECYNMAMRYLEKIFPSQHNIELPRLDEMILERSYDIELKYCSKVQPDNNLQNSEGQYILKDIFPNVILKELFRKTRIVFGYSEYDSENIYLYPFLPRTMRELTHFLKLLRDMENVDFEMIYNKTFAESENFEASAEIEKLQRNIQSVKQYFLNYWCANHLKSAQKRLISDIDESDRDKKIKSTVQLLNAHFDDKDKNKILPKTVNSYQDLLWEVYKNETIQNEELLSASLSIYFTLFLSEWFALALRNKAERKRFIAFVETLTAAQQQKDNAYHLDRFTVKIDDVREIMGEQQLDGEFEKCLEYFCEPLGVEGEEKILREKNGILKWNTEVEEVKLDIYRPIMMSFVNGWDYFKDMAAPNPDLAAGRSEQGKIKETEYVSALHIFLSNCDLQQNFMLKADKKRRKVNRKNSQESWRNYISDLYNEILNKSLEKVNSWSIDNSGDRESLKAFTELWEDLVKYRVTPLVPLFLAEPNNRRLFNESLKSSLDKRMKELRTDAEKIPDIMNESYKDETNEFIVDDNLHESLALLLNKFGDETSFFPPIVSELRGIAAHDVDASDVIKKSPASRKRGANTAPEAGSIAELHRLIHKANTLTEACRELQTGIENWMNNPNDIVSGEELMQKITKMISVCKDD